MLVWAIALTSYFVHRTRTLRLRRIVAIPWWSLRLTGIRQWAGTTYVTSGATFATRINPRTRVSVFMFEFPYLCGRLDWTDVVFVYRPMRIQLGARFCQHVFVPHVRTGEFVFILV